LCPCRVPFGLLLLLWCWCLVSCRYRLPPPLWLCCLRLLLLMVDRLPLFCLVMLVLVMMVMLVWLSVCTLSRIGSAWQVWPALVVAGSTFAPVLLPTLNLVQPSGSNGLVLIVECCPLPFRPAHLCFWSISAPERDLRKTMRSYGHACNRTASVQAIPDTRGNPGRPRPPGCRLFSDESQKLSRSRTSSSDQPRQGRSGVDEKRKSSRPILFTRKPIWLQ
jgi:hypothetical protein